MTAADLFTQKPNWRRWNVEGGNFAVVLFTCDVAHENLTPENPVFAANGYRGKSYCYGNELFALGRGDIYEFLNSSSCWVGTLQLACRKAVAVAPQKRLMNFRSMLIDAVKLGELLNFQTSDAVPRSTSPSVGGYILIIRRPSLTRE